MAEKSDLEIIRLVLSGDTDLFEILVDRYKLRVFKIVSSHIPPEHTEEVAGDVFFKVFKSLTKFKNDSPFIHYISVIAVNTCRDFWRASYSNREQVFSSFDESVEKTIENSPSGKTPEDELLENERQKLLIKAMDCLNPNERTIISMIYSEERSIAEVANIMEMTESNIKVTAFRARKKLADILNKISGGNI